MEIYGHKMRRFRRNIRNELRSTYNRWRPKNISGDFNSVLPSEEEKGR